MIDLSPILRVVSRVRNRVRVQNSLEWVTTFASLGLLVSLSFAALGRLGALSASASSAGVLLGFLLIPVGLVVGLLRPVTAISAAKRIDMSHGLKDRFSSAIDFSARKNETSEERQALFEQLSMKEAVSFAGEVKPSKAAPFAAPKDLAGAFGLALAFALVSMLKLPSEGVANQPKPLHNLSPVLVDSFDLQQQKEKAKQLLEEALNDGDKKTAELAQKLLNVWAAVERGELTQEAALRQLAAIEKELADAAKQKESLEKTAGELAKAFEKNKDTKELADALKNKDFEKAAQELEKLADKMDKMSDKERQELQKALEEAAKLAEEIAKEQKRELDDPEDEEKQDDEQKTPEEREQEEKQRELDDCASLDLSSATKEELEECNKNFDKKELEDRRRELEEDKRELEKLRRENKEKQEQEERKRELEKLSRDMKKAAEELEKKLTPEQKEALKQAAEQMKKMGQKQKYANRQQQAAGKIADAKNVIIRGGKGQNGQAQNFRDRAGQKGQQGKNGQQGQGQDGQGQEGQGQQGKNGQQPGDGEGEGQEGQNGKNGKGQGQGQGQGQGNGKGDTYVIDLDNPGQGDAQIELPGMGEGQQPGDKPGDQPGGEGQEPGGDNWGNGSKDPYGNATDMNVNFRNEKLTGRKGAGPTKVEVIERVAQEGLVGAQYKKVYKEATREAEDSLEREQVPVGYKRFTKRYFDLIQPQ